MRPTCPTTRPRALRRLKAALRAQDAHRHRAHLDLLDAAAAGPGARLLFGPDAWACVAAFLHRDRTWWVPTGPRVRPGTGGALVEVDASGHLIAAILASTWWRSSGHIPAPPEHRETAARVYQRLGAAVITSAGQAARDRRVCLT